jgi:hypothetical protein
LADDSAGGVVPKLSREFGSLLWLTSGSLNSGGVTLLAAALPLLGGLALDTGMTAFFVVSLLLTLVGESESPCGPDVPAALAGSVVEVSVDATDAAAGKALSTACLASKVKHCTKASEVGRRLGDH